MVEKLSNGLYRYVIENNMHNRFLDKFSHYVDVERELSEHEIQILRNILYFFPHNLTNHWREALVPENFKNYPKELLTIAANAYETPGNTVLGLAAETGTQFQAVNLLLDMGANLETEDHRCGKLALHWAVANKVAYKDRNAEDGTSMLSLLLERGANPENKCYENMTILEYAKTNNYSAAVKTIQRYIATNAKRIEKPSEKEVKIAKADTLLEAPFMNSSTYSSSNDKLNMHDFVNMAKNFNWGEIDHLLSKYSLWKPQSIVIAAFIDSFHHDQLYKDKKGMSAIFDNILSNVVADSPFRVNLADFYCAYNIATTLFKDLPIHIKTIQNTIAAYVQKNKINLVTGFDNTTEVVSIVELNKQGKQIPMTGRRLIQKCNDVFGDLTITEQTKQLFENEVNKAVSIFLVKTQIANQLRSIIAKKIEECFDLKPETCTVKPYIPFFDVFYRDLHSIEKLNSTYNVIKGTAIVKNLNKTLDEANHSNSINFIGVSSEKIRECTSLLKSWGLNAQFINIQRGHYQPYTYIELFSPLNEVITVINKLIEDNKNTHSRMETNMPA